MAEISHDGDHEEYYAEFIRVRGKRGLVLIFTDEANLEADKDLAEEIGLVLDKDPEESNR